MLSPAQIIEVIRKNPRIPAPSQTVFKILSLTRDPSCDMNKVAALIASDAGLTAQLLREVNSALYAGTKATSSVAQACLRIGLKRVRSAVINQHVVSGLGKSCPPGFDANRHFQAALATSVAAHDLCKDICPGQADDAGTAGLLCDFGIGLLAYGVREDYQHVLNELKKQPTAHFHTLEQRILKVTHCEVGAAVLTDWGLDTHIIDAVRHHHCEPFAAAKQELAVFSRIITAAVTLARLALDGSDMDVVTTLFEQVESITKNADAVVSRLLDSLVGHLQESARMLAVEIGETSDMEDNLQSIMNDLQAIVG